jgi:thiamine kinase-like enzyme
MVAIVEQAMSEAEIFAYLLDRGLVPRSAVVSGEVHVVDVSRRNHNFRVIGSGGLSLLVKQGIIRDGFSSIEREARAYMLLGGLAPSDGANSVFPYTPRALEYDTHRDVLILEFLVAAPTVRRVHLTRRPPSCAVARLVGDALARLHRYAGTEVTHKSAENLLGYGEPGVLSLLRPGLTLFRDFSSACVDLVRLVQDNIELRDSLTRLQQDWRTDAVIHHDLRFDNILLTGPRGDSAVRRSRVTFVDWETAALGDAGWDIGTVIGEYLGLWLSSIPGAYGQSPEQLLHLATRPLDSVQPAIMAFWSSYCKKLDLQGVTAAEQLIRATRFSGLKLIQSAVEQVQRQARFNIQAVTFLQTGANILSRPEQAAEILLGFGRV